MRSRSKPKAPVIARDEQLRRAKRAQRRRQRAAGLVDVQMTLPKATAEKLAVARRIPEFLALLEDMLDRAVVRIDDYPQLKDLAWNRSDAFIAAKEAFQLYERNWRFVDGAHLDARERALIDRLASEFGAGVINA